MEGASFISGLIFSLSMNKRIFGTQILSRYNCSAGVPVTAETFSGIRRCPCYLVSQLKVWVVYLWSSFNILVDDCPTNWAICSISPLKWSFVHRFVCEFSDTLHVWHGCEKLCCSSCVVQAEPEIKYRVIAACVVINPFNVVCYFRLGTKYLISGPLYLKTDKLISLIFTRKDNLRRQ